MSTYRRSFFALRGANPDHAQMPPVPGISLSGGNAFTIECIFYTQHRNDEDVFIKQNNVFSMGMTNGMVYFEAEKLGRIQTVAAKTPIEENAWTCMTVVYDGSKLLLYLQGFLAIEKTVGAGILHIDTNTRYQIGMMEGYLLEIAIYSKALTADEVRKNQFTPQVQDTNTELLLDFDAFVPLDKGKHKLPLQLISSCNTVNLTYSLLCSKVGCALPVGTSPVNPGGVGLSNYTILVKAYVQHNKIVGDTYLFANGSLDQPETIAIGLSDGQTHPFFSVGTQRFAFDRTIMPGCWVDVAVTVSGQTVALYLDGVASGTATLSAPFIRQGQAALTLGNILTNNRFENGFMGLIGSVSVFSAALPASRLLVYSDIAPYAFDSDLAALWAFNDSESAEILHGSIVSMTGGAEIALCENTLLDRTVPEIAFAIPDIQTGLDALQIWEANTAAKAFGLCVKELTGMEPVRCFTAEGKLYGSLCRVVYAEYKDNVTLGEMEIKQEATAQNMGDILKYALIGAGLGIICYGMYALYASRSHRTFTAMMRFKRWMSKLSAIGASHSTLGGGVAGAMTGELVRNSPPNSDKAKTDTYELSLISLCFFNTESETAGALCAKPDFTHPPIVPEWVHDVTPNAPALYYRNIPTGKTPLLRAVFAVTLKKSGSTTITLGAKALGGSNSLVLGELAAKTITVTASGNQTVDFPLTSNLLRQAVLGKHQISWNWYYQSKSQHVLKTTTHQIHVIHDKPLSPWTTAKDSDCLPVYSLLTYCAEIAARTEAETEPNKRFANQLVDWTHSSNRFTALGLKDNAHYARWDRHHRKLTVDLKKLTAELEKTAVVPVTFMDIACLQLLLTRLEGLPNLCLFEMKTVLGGPLHTRNAKGLGNLALSNTFIPAYYTCGMKGADKKATVWDAFAILKAPDGTDLKAKGTSFSEYPCKKDMIGLPDKTRYRTLLCCTGGTCRIAMSAQRLFMGVLPVQKIWPALDHKHLCVFGGRPPFAQEIKSQLVLQPHDVRCHSISYAYMQQSIIHLINTFLDAQDNSHLNSCIEGIKFLIQAVTLTDEYPDYTVDSQGYDAWLALYGNGENFGLNDWLADKTTSMSKKAASADTLLCTLNSNLKNLRLGKSDWNSSLQEHYDCREWVYVYVGDDGNLYFGSSSDNPLLNTVATSIGGFSFKEPGFYLLNKTYDGDRLCTLAELALGEWKLPFTTFKIGALVNETISGLNATDTRRPILYSSSNKWNLETYEIDLLEDGEAPAIYVKYDISWAQL